MSFAQDHGRRMFETLLPAEPASASAARAAVQTQCRRWGLGRLCDDAALVTTELVANAVRHARTEVRLRLCPVPDGIRVEVCDGSTRALRPRKAELLDEGGRGLVLVDALSAHVGTERHADGKTVWAELMGVPA
jgi:anti-sigma regulatory factor (Ser/Thr protein kinase)